MAVDAMNERFEEVEFQGKTVLFTDCRVQKDTIPMVCTVMRYGIPTTIGANPVSSATAL